ncbi:Eco57I restriction-modification methylase domain-containing protein [Amylibacter sp.]|nr:Eco57I restriction-modification methylase domain-containing protein [Amylibacter sp.]
MSEQASFTLRNRNPDVLTCIANLSNDEVFTPPELANKMLDTLTEAWAEDNNGANMWENENIRFLDPCTKTGVFLREITARLTIGLEKKIPKLEKRVEHILSRQVFGIGITKLTSLLARRSVYCSKNADGENSIAKNLKSKDGNIWFERDEHKWKNGKCVFCGTSRSVLDRDLIFDNHAYTFIHTDNIGLKINELFGAKMQFDVIIGNPPYQLQDVSNSASAKPIYQKFIDQAIQLQPKYLIMITPSRWFSGGKGLDAFRAARLKDTKMKSIVDFIVDKDAFPKININGGVNFFLWSNNYDGDCTIQTVESGGVFGEPKSRSLNEFDIFIRRNEAVEILRKVQVKTQNTFDKCVSSRKPFGLPTNFFGSNNQTEEKNIKLYSSGKITWIKKSEVINNDQWIDEWKVLIPRATDGNENYPLPIWDARGPIVSGPGEACTETYLIASVAKSKKEAEMIREYMRTKFFRFLVSLRKITQDNKSDLFSFVPLLGMNKHWNDEMLYSMYDISNEEMEFIDSMIRTMEW